MVNNDYELFKTMAKLRDFFNGASEACDEFVQLMGKVATREYDVSKIVWLQKEGDKGAYELANDKDNKENKEYIALKEHLKESQGKISKDGLFYWLFQDGAAIGRKPQRKQ